MAHFIPVDGPVGSEEAYGELVLRSFPSGCLMAFERLEDGRQILSRLDVTEINATATEMADGRTIYGDAVLFSGSEL
jgi:hypothetical protein